MVIGKNRYLAPGLNPLGGPQRETLMIEAAQFYGASFVNGFSDVANGILWRGHAPTDKDAPGLVTLDAEDFRTVRCDGPP